MVSPYLLSLNYHLQLILNFAAVFLNFYSSYCSLFWLMAVFGFYWTTLWSHSLLDNLQALPLLLPWSAKSTMSLLSQPGGSVHRRCRVRVFLLMYALCVFMRGCLCLQCSYWSQRWCPGLSCSMCWRGGLWSPWRRTRTACWASDLAPCSSGWWCWPSGEKRAKAGNNISVCETAELPNNPGNCFLAEKRIELCDFC